MIYFSYVKALFYNLLRKRIIIKSTNYFFNRFSLKIKRQEPNQSHYLAIAAYLFVFGYHTSVQELLVKTSGKGGCVS
jgi:hypothetical protein